LPPVYSFFVNTPGIRYFKIIDPPGHFSTNILKLENHPISAALCNAGGEIPP
jgi:hypothetical protein